MYHLAFFTLAQTTIVVFVLAKLLAAYLRGASATYAISYGLPFVLALDCIPSSVFLVFAFPFCVSAVMSMNIQIFQHQNKMALEYYLYLYLCHFSSTNIFSYSLVDFWTTEYIQIFVGKFLKIKIYLNICSLPYLNICLSIFDEQVNLDTSYASKNIQCKIVFKGNMSEPFSKISLISDEYEYLNKMTRGYYLYS